MAADDHNGSAARDAAQNSTAPAITMSACPLISSAIMIGPLWTASQVGRLAFFFEEAGAPATAVGNPVFQLGDTKATVTT